MQESELTTSIIFRYLIGGTIFRNLINFGFETLLRVVQSLVCRCYFSYISYLILVVLYLLLVVLCLVAGTHNIIIALI